MESGTQRGKNNFFLCLVEHSLNEMCATRSLFSRQDELQTFVRFFGIVERLHLSLEVAETVEKTIVGLSMAKKLRTC